MKRVTVPFQKPSSPKGLWSGQTGLAQGRKQTEAQTHFQPGEKQEKMLENKSILEWKLILISLWNKAV